VSQRTYSVLSHFAAIIFDSPANEIERFWPIKIPQDYHGRRSLVCISRLKQSFQSHTASLATFAKEENRTIFVRCN
jgi:hypothetical protein